jgi:tRNA-dihydrouridine synthase B
MSGVSDLPFRRLAQRLGAAMVVTEMIASRDLVLRKPDTMRRARGEGETASPLVIQLTGREARWMAEGAKVAGELGADIIDINMGCPAKQVTRGASGSALMRDEEHALSLIEAVVGATDVPVTLKMRMGWDHARLNAPALARRAEAAGVQMITVHGRTRCQFFNGSADWKFVSRVKDAVSIPVVVNGDARDIADLPAMLAASRADGVMIGRGAYGRPWFPGRACAFLAAGDDPGDPPLARQKTIALEHYEDMLAHYGTAFGTRIARKHLGWYVEAAARDRSTIRAWRARLCRTEDPGAVRSALSDFYDIQMEAAA